LHPSCIVELFCPALPDDHRPLLFLNLADARVTSGAVRRGLIFSLHIKNASIDPPFRPPPPISRILRRIELADVRRT
jgi:hypothetical protein